MFQCTFSFSIRPSFSFFPLHLFVFERFSCPPHCFFVGALCAIFHCMFCVSLPSRFLRACSPLATRVEQAVLGKEHNLNVFLSSNLALCLNKKGDLRAAVQLQQRVHDVLVRVLPSFGFACLMTTDQRVIPLFLFAFAVHVCGVSAEGECRLLSLQLPACELQSGFADP